MKSGQELRDMVDNLHLRSPKDVMGEAASSSLLGSTMTAALSTVVLLLAFTVIVFVIGGGPEKKTEAAATQAPSSPEPKALQTPAAAITQQDSADQPAKTDTDAAIEAMGIGDAKDAESKPETLENRLDQLLDGLE